MTFRLLSEDVTSGPNSTHPAETDETTLQYVREICHHSVTIELGGLQTLLILQSIPLLVRAEYS